MADIIPNQLRAALELLTSAQLLISVQRQDAQEEPVAQTATIAVAGEVAAEHVPLPDGEHRITIFPAARVLDHTAQLSGLVERYGPGPRHLSVIVTGDQLLAAGERAQAGDIGAAAGVLTRTSAAGGDAATALAEALATQPAAVHVTVLETGTEGRLEGTVTGWLDAGDHGLWRIPATAGPDEEIEVRLVSVTEILDEISEGFPQLHAG